LTSDYVDETGEYKDEKKKLTFPAAKADDIIMIEM